MNLVLRPMLVGSQVPTHHWLCVLCLVKLGKIMHLKFRILRFLRIKATEIGCNVSPLFPIRDTFEMVRRSRQQELKKCLRRDLAISPKALSDFDMKVPRKIGARMRRNGTVRTTFRPTQQQGSKRRDFNLFGKRVLVFLPEGFYKFH